MLSEFCRQVIELDPGIRFAGVAQKNGRLAASRYRKDIVPLLGRSRLELSVVRLQSGSAPGKALSMSLEKRCI